MKVHILIYSRWLRWISVGFGFVGFILPLTTDEAIALRTEDFDPTNGLLRVSGKATRSVVVPAWLARCVSPPVADGPLLADDVGNPLTVDEIASLVVCAALDAGLHDAPELTAQALRHTCIAWLVRQGVRFTDLATLVGRPDAAMLAFYARLADDSPRHAAATLEPLMPALREFGA